MELKYIYIGLGIAFLILVAIGLAIVNFSFDEFKSNFDRENKNFCSYITSLQLINMIGQKLRRSFNVIVIDKEYGDSYSPYKNTIKVYKNNLNSKSLASLTVIAHELGHAMQCAYTPDKMKAYFKKVSISNIISNLIIPSIIISIVLLFVLEESIKFYAFILIGFAFICFIYSLSLKLSTIKIEKEASDYAIDILRDFAKFDEDEIRKSKELLNSAKNTYVANFLKSLLKWTFLTRR